MSDQTDPRRVHPSTYFVPDRSNEEELARLQMQDKLVTSIMGGALPEQPDPTIFKRVLDVGCGTGDWLIEAASTYPTMTLLVGVDANEHLIAYARAQAAARQLSDRVEFHTMDALQMLEFPTNFFDLVNQRFAWSFLRTWEWPHLLREYQRVTRRGGVVRVTEADINLGPEGVYPALSRLSELLLNAFYQAGHFFAAEENAVTSQLTRLLRQFGFQDVETRPYTLEYQANTPEGQFLIENTRHLFRTAAPFLRKWTQVPDDYEALYEQGLRETQQPNFVATWSFLTAWGKNLPTVPAQPRP
jgi:ubiquinone/menaquinone biosynthesis C-methylase UbiE